MNRRYRILLPDRLRERAGYRPLKTPPPDAALAQTRFPYELSTDPVYCHVALSEEAARVA